MHQVGGERFAAPPMPNVIQSQIYQKFFVFVESQSLRPRTKTAYLRRVRLLARYFPKRSLKQIGERQVFDYLLHLRDHDKLRPSTLNQALVAVRMFYRDFLGLDWKLWREFIPLNGIAMPRCRSFSPAARFGRSSPPCGRIGSKRSWR